LSTPPLQQPHTSTLPELAVHAALASRRLTVPNLSPSLSEKPLALPLSELFGFIFFRLLILLGYMVVDFDFGIEFDLILAF
jgi:hypothetical protein